MRKKREIQRTDQQQLPSFPSVCFPMPRLFLSHDAAVNLVSGPQWHIFSSAAGWRQFNNILHQNKVTFIKSESCSVTTHKCEHTHTHIHKYCTVLPTERAHWDQCTSILQTPWGISSVHLSSQNGDVPKGRFLLIPAWRDQTHQAFFFFNG